MLSRRRIAQLLDLVVHSLYTDKDFVRELISNAADASEKLEVSRTDLWRRDFRAGSAAEDQRPLRTTRQKTITFTDTGIGVTHGN